MSSPLPQSTLDIRAARATASFSSQVLHRVLSAGSRDPAVRERITKLLQADPIFDKGKKAYMSRAERVEQGLQMTNRLLTLKELHQWTPAEYSEAMVAADESLPLTLHESAFLPVIAAQASDEQQKVWLHRAANHEIFGAYLQTELGHGSNVQALETTATYDPAKQEFIIDSPTVTSTKWWIGALGLTATHGAVQAQLSIGGKNFGPHLFLVQLRSLENHATLPGITIGEIGPKAHGGYAPIDNGWASFDHVRIPRDQLLARFAQVAPDGAYTTPPHAKLSYGGMIYIRANMIGGLGWSLAKAVTISTRYLHIRRQFSDPELIPGQETQGAEHRVITYPSVYRRVIPQVAKAFVFITAGKDMQQLYTTMSQQLKGGDTTLLAETHAVSAGLKSYVSTSVVEGIEVVRRAMGGHGYLDAAGIGKIFSKELPSVTYEGENFVLNLQVSRAAVKILRALRKTPSLRLSPSTVYLASLSSTSPSGSSFDWLSRPLQLHLISLRAALKVERLERLVASGKPFAQLSWECVGITNAIVEAFLVRRILEALEDGGLLSVGAGPAEKKVLATLINFYVLTTLEFALPDLVEFAVVPPSTSLASPAETLRAQIDDLAQKLLPELVGLTDSFGFSDWDLDSELGKFDGRAYESLLEKAKRDLDINVGDGAKRQELYEKEIRPILLRGRKLSAKL